MVYCTGQAPLAGGRPCARSYRCARPNPLLPSLGVWRQRRVSKSDIVKESVSPYLCEARIRTVRRQLIRRAKRTGVTAEAEAFRAV